MKKLILIGILIAVLAMTLFPVIAGASVCTPRCCCFKCEPRWYKVSYFDEAHVWTSEYVLAWNFREAAGSLNLTAGRDCFVGRAVGYTG